MRTLILMPALTLTLGAQTPVDYSLLQQEVQAANAAIEAGLEAQSKAGTPRASLRPDLDAALRPLRVRGGTATGELRQACLVAELAVAAQWSDAAVLAKRAVQEIPADAPAWRALPAAALPFLPNILGPGCEAYIRQMGERGLPDRRVPVLVGLADSLMEAGKLDEAQSLVDRLQKENPERPEVARCAAMIAGERATAVGAEAPDFKLADLDDAARTLTKASFKGRYLLVDFWGTWCGWCKAELPNTHRVFAAYKDKGLDILSLAADPKPESVIAFRRKPETPMPWHHAFIGYGKDQDPIVKAFGVRGYPALFLIGPDGRILAKGMDLRGESLEPTLRKCMHL